MRWEALFADLQAELEAGQSVDLAAEVADRSRREAARLRLADRLRGSVGCRLIVAAAGGTAVRGRLDAVGPDWLLVSEGLGRAALLPAAAVLSIIGLGRLAAEPGSESPLGARLALCHALRGLVRDRAAVAITLSDGTVLGGTLDRVGADFVELAEHPVREPRRPSVVNAVHTLPLAAIAAVRSA